MSYNSEDFKNLDLLKPPQINSIDWDEIFDNKISMTTDASQIFQEEFAFDTYSSPKFVHVASEAPQSQKQTIVPDNYFSFEKSKDKLDSLEREQIQLLISRNRELEDLLRITEQKAKSLEKDVEFKEKELQKARHHMTQLANQFDTYVTQFHQQKQTINELDQRNTILSMQINLKNQNLLKEELPNLKLINDRLINTIKQLEQYKHRPQPSIKDCLDRFVATTIKLDEVYFRMLAHLDEDLVHSDMEELELLSSIRKQQLEKVYAQI